MSAVGARRRSPIGGRLQKLNRLRLEVVFLLLDDPPFDSVTGDGAPHEYDETGQMCHPKAAKGRLRDLKLNRMSLFYTFHGSNRPTAARKIVSF
jgi:hypothetical protein